MKKRDYTKPKIAKSKIQVKLYKKQSEVEELLLSSTYLAVNCTY